MTVVNRLLITECRSVKTLFISIQVTNF